MKNFVTRILWHEARQKRLVQEFSCLFHFDALVFERLGFFLRTRFAPKLRGFVFALVIVSGPDEPVSPGNVAAVHAPDIFLYLPLRGKRLGREDVLIDPEKDETADKVCHDCGNDLAHRGKNDTDTGKDRGTCLPAEEVERISFEIDLHVLRYLTGRIMGFLARYYSMMTLYPADKIVGNTLL